MPKCSFCDEDAMFVGQGTDGDFYCWMHAYLAPGGLVMTDEDRPNA